MNAFVTETLMNMSDLDCDQTIVYAEAKKRGTFQAHVLAEDLEGMVTIASLKQCLAELEKQGKVKRIESIRLGTMWKAV
jgi:hypothetical protein